MNKLIDFLHGLKNVKWYVIIVMICYGVFTWAGFTGRRILGDDTDEKEVRSGAGARNGFYHK